MRIGHYMTGLSDPGGIGNYIRRVSRAQREEGNIVVYFDHLSRLPDARPDAKTEAQNVIYAESDADLLRKAAQADVDILHIHTTVEVGADAPVPVIRTLHGHQPYCPSGTRYFKRQACPCDRAYSVVGCTWGHFVNRCGSIRPHNLLNDFRRTHIERETMRHIPVIAVSDYLKREMVRIGYAPDRIHVLHTYAPEPKEFAPPPQGGVPRFAYIGRMTPEKGVDWFLRAAQQVKTPIAIDLAGEGPAEADLKRLTAERGLQDRVTFHGWVQSAQVHALLAGARALVFPSVWHEPGGAVAGEAMANGRAVIMSRVGGMPEYVQQDVNGLLVGPNDTEALARAMERFAGDWELARALGVKGSQIAQERFSFRAHIQTLQRLYEQTAATKQRAVAQTPLTSASISGR